MLLTYEQCKYLKITKNGQFEFINNDNKATKLEKEELIDLDDLCLEIEGEHLIINYEDLKK